MFFRRNKKLQGYTLLEIVIVVVIVGILVSLGLVNYTNVRERALGKEAKATLKLIAAAERIYNMETRLYLIPAEATSPPTNATETVAYINAMLKLAIPKNATWDYDITGYSGSPSSGGLPTFNAQATNVRNNCIYDMAHDDPDDEPNPSGTCY